MQRGCSTAAQKICWPDRLARARRFCRRLCQGKRHQPVMATRARRLLGI